MKPVTVDELQRAWRAVEAGAFRGVPAGRLGATSEFDRVWTPAPGERVLLVSGCGGSVGATTFALALATAREGRARVVECCPAAASGLAAAASRELGTDASGWVRGSRDAVLLERSAPGWGMADVPVPASVDEPTFTVIDLGGGTPTGWRAGALADARALVLVTRATVPGLRRLETHLSLWGPGRQVVAAVLGPARKRWPRTVEGAVGALTRSLEAQGLLVAVPEDPQLALHGITPAPLPTRLLSAAGLVLDRVEGIA